MAWNEPGGGNKDPWGQGGGNQGPPDLDELIRKLQAKFGGLFGGARKGGGGTATGGGGGGFLSIGLLLGIGVLVWLASGIYIIDEGKRGVVLRFGEFHTITGPGPHWHVPYPVDSVEVVDVALRRFEEIGYRTTAGRSVVVPKEALMLTRDENIVNVQMAVQYQVSDPRQFLFNVRDPRATLQQAAESSLREVVGKSRMDFVLTEGRSDVVMQVRALMQQMLDDYQAGLLVSEVSMQDVQPPEEVQGAFSDAIRAREDEQRFKNEAEAYSNDIIPRARGQSARLLEEANAYKESQVARAEGEASRFTQLLTEYKRAPEVTRKRLYLETMESVLQGSSKVLVDVKDGNSLMYLPLDRLIKGAGEIVTRPGEGYTSSGGSPAAPGSLNSRPPQQIRETR
jgi:membrane protease subunit HflK